MHCSKCVSFWGTSYSRPPYSLPPCYKILAAPLAVASGCAPVVRTALLFSLSSITTDTCVVRTALEGKTFEQFPPWTSPVHPKCGRGICVEIIIGNESVPKIILNGAIKFYS